MNKKWVLIGGGAALLVVVIVVVVFFMGEKPPPPPPPPPARVTGPDPAHLAKVAALAAQVADLEAKGRFREALAVLKQLETLEPKDPRPKEFRPRLEDKQRKLEAWQGAQQKADSARDDAVRRNAPADWQKALDLAAAASALAFTDEQRKAGDATSTACKRGLPWSQALAEEKAGKLAAARALIEQAVAVGPPPPELAAYQAKLEAKQKKEAFDRAASAARAEGAPAKAYELWEKAAALAVEAKDVEESKSRLSALKPFVDPAEREKRWEESLAAGDAALAGGELDAAEKAFKAAQALKAGDAKASQGLAKVGAARRAKGVDAALAEIKAAEDKKEWADAVEAIDRALRLKPGDGALTAKRKQIEETHRPPRITLVLSDTTNVKMEFVRIPRGGAVGREFWMAATETTQAQWQIVMGTKPWVSPSVPILPVEGVTWDDAQKFAAALAVQQEAALGGRKPALPTEAEWEHACRAGATSKFSFGDDENQLDLHGWFTKNAGKAPMPVGGKRANAWGLYDLHGNVAEWCADEAGKGSDDTPLRALRGGSWNDRAENCRSGRREVVPPAKNSQFAGFRVILR
jgi:formylglycine-generating enzyme required for sulfatase activity